MTGKLSRRETVAVTAAGMAIIVFLVIQFGVFPVLDKKAALQRSYSQKVRNLAEMQALSETYRRVRMETAQAARRFSGREKGFTLFSFLDNLAGVAGVKDHITYMKPSSGVSKDGGFKVSTVEMELKAVTMEMLARYLQMIETSGKSVFVRRLSIVATTNPDGFITTVMQVETYDLS